ADARLHLGVLERSGGTVTELADAQGDAVHAAAAQAGLIVDALLGTGLNQQPTGLVARAIAEVVAQRRSRAVPVVAVDIPSGVPSETGEVTWETIEADVTVTF